MENGKNDSARLKKREAFMNGRSNSTETILSTKNCLCILHVLKKGKENMKDAGTHILDFKYSGLTLFFFKIWCKKKNIFWCKKWSKKCKNSGVKLNWWKQKYPQIFSAQTFLYKIWFFGRRSSYHLKP